MRIITVSREFGSGGRAIAKKLAQTLEIPYYDREIITKMAEELSISETYIDNILHKGATNAYSVGISHSFSNFLLTDYKGPSLLAEQNKIVRKIAENGDCVIVGRSADASLEDVHPFNIFVYADMQAKIRRCKERAEENEKLSDKELEKRIKAIDKIRAANHDLVSSFPWGDKRNYHLCINSTDVDVDIMVPSLAEYISKWFEKQGR